MFDIFKERLKKKKKQLGENLQSKVQLQAAMFHLMF